MLDFLFEKLNELKQEREKLIVETIEKGIENEHQTAIYYFVKNYRECTENFRKERLTALGLGCIYIPLIALISTYGFSIALIVCGIVLTLIEGLTLVDLVNFTKEKKYNRGKLEKRGISLDSSIKDLQEKKIESSNNYVKSQRKLDNNEVAIKRIERIISRADLSNALNEDIGLLREYLNFEYQKFLEEIKQIDPSKVDLEPDHNLEIKTNLESFEQIQEKVLKREI